MKGLDRGLGRRGKRVRQGLMKIRRVGMGWQSLEGKSLFNGRIPGDH